MTSPYTNQDHLGFYLQHGISPVRQDISDLDKHLQRRGNLYRRLGISELAVSGRHILEVGPGSGHNSLLLASWEPDSLDLLEPNPTGRDGINELYATFDRPHTPPHVIPEALQDFSPSKLYDIAIAEAWIGGTEDELLLMKKMATLVRPGGFLITTVTSPISMLANTFRRILGDIMIADIEDIKEQTIVLDEAFGSHLATMTDMSRPNEDWIQDSLLNPGFLTSSLTVEKFLSTLGDNMMFSNSFPRISTDWRWYKSFYGDGIDFDTPFLQNNYEQCHNLFDYRSQTGARDPEMNKRLEKDCENLVTIVANYWNLSKLPLKDEIIACTLPIRDSLRDLSSVWAASVDEFLKIYSQDIITPADTNEMTALRPIFGRELMYIATQKVSE
jgi:hypothetical protein